MAVVIAPYEHPPIDWYAAALGGNEFVSLVALWDQGRLWGMAFVGIWGGGMGRLLEVVVSLIKTLLSITHHQWLFRNVDVHHRFDGLTMHGHNLLSLRINDLLETSPGDLLPVHRYLL